MPTIDITRVHHHCRLSLSTPINTFNCQWHMYMDLPHHLHRHHQTHHRQEATPCALSLPTSNLNLENIGESRREWGGLEERREDPLSYPHDTFPLPPLIPTITTPSTQPTTFLHPLHHPPSLPSTPPPPPPFTPYAQNAPSMDTRPPSPNTPAAEATSPPQNPHSLSYLANTPCPH